jgi:hypothetical protein
MELGQRKMAKPQAGRARFKRRASSDEGSRSRLALELAAQARASQIDNLAKHVRDADHKIRRTCAAFET